MKRLHRLMLLGIIFIFLLSACNYEEYQIERLLEDYFPSFDSELFPLPQPENHQRIDGFGMGSSTNLRLGATEHATIAEAYKAQAEMGVQYVREEFPMAYIQQEVNRYDFNSLGYDKMVAAAEANGLEIVALLVYGPSVPYGNDDAFLNLWEGYVTALVTQYGDLIDYWEIGNEMNVKSFWRKVRPNAQAVEPGIYAQMLEIAYQIIKGNDPTDTVIVGGLINDADFMDGFSPLAFLREVNKYLSTQGRFFDAVGLHTYWGAGFPGTPHPQLVYEDNAQLSMADYVQMFADDVARLFGEDIPIWITEVGYDYSWAETLGKDYYSIDAESVQAIALARVYTSLLSIPQVRAVFWYTYAHDGQGSEDFVLRPAGRVVFQTLAKGLTGTKPLGRFEIVDESGQAVENTFEYRFLKSYGDTVSVYWSNDPEKMILDAFLHDLPAGPVLKFQIDGGMDTSGVEIEDDGVISIMVIPEILLGQMDQDTQIIVGSPSPEVYSGKGQIAYLVNGNVFYQNFETGLEVQITSDANFEADFLHVYWNLKFSPSGRYLTYEYGDMEDDSKMTMVIDLIQLNEIKRFEGDMILGWLHDQDVLRYGHNSESCEHDPMDPVSDESTPNENISFLVFEYDPGLDSTHQLISIPGGYRMPGSIFSSENLMSFQLCSCDYFECSFAREIYNDQGGLFYEVTSLGTSFSNDLQSLINIYFNIHGPETAALQVIDVYTGSASDIYYREGRFPSSAWWSSDDRWIVFWLGDSDSSYDYETNLMKIHPDGTGAEEINPTPERVIGWYPDSRLMLLPKSEDRILLYDLDTGGTEALVTLDADVSGNSLIWGKVP